MTDLGLPPHIQPHHFAKRCHPNSPRGARVVDKGAAAPRLRLSPLHFFLSHGSTLHARSENVLD
jgi:hypothetical protein